MLLQQFEQKQKRFQGDIENIFSELQLKAGEEEVAKHYMRREKAYAVSVLVRLLIRRVAYIFI